MNFRTVCMGCAVFLTAILFSNPVTGAGSVNEPEIDALYSLHKQAAESGDETVAKRIEAEIHRLHGDNVYLSKPVQGTNELSKPETGQEGDWLTPDQKIYQGPVGVSAEHKRSLDLKFGEDNNLYAAVNVGPSEYSSGNIRVFRSADYGKTWTQILNYSGFVYISSISMLVESRNNNVGDSTRVVVFHTVSSSSNFDGAELRYVSIRRDGNGFYSGSIASPAAGNEFTSVSALSDGAYYQGATYIGVVCTEVNDLNTSAQNLRYFRSVNWGSTWVGATIATGFQDFNPSAAYKYTGDSVFIAVERRIAYNDKQIRLIATKFTPTSAHNVRNITSGSLLVYENPCLTIQQSQQSDSMLITAERGSYALSFHSTNYGAAWTNEQNHSGSGNISSTYCSSWPTGDNPFTICWVDNSGGTQLNVLSGKLGTYGNSSTNVNSYNYISNWVLPVCVSVNMSGTNTPAVAYAGSGPLDVYFDMRTSKMFYLTYLPQAMYNPVSNRLNRQDTVRVYLRKYSDYSQIVDSATAPINIHTFEAEIQFGKMDNADYYIEARTRNTIAVWSLIPSTSAGYVWLDVVRYPYYVLGSNEIRVNNALNYYAAYSGDVNQDGIVDGTDTQLIDNDANAFVSGFSVQDLNGDNFVDGTDALYAGNNAYNFVSVVTPP